MAAVVVFNPLKFWGGGAQQEIVDGLASANSHGNQASH